MKESNENITKLDALDIVSEYYKAWSGKDFEKAGSFLAEDIKIEVPINSYETKQAFLEAVKFTSQAISKVNILSELGKGNEALLLYDMLIEPLGNLRVAEHFVIKNGKIAQIRQIHDTALFREAGFKPDNV